VVIDSSPNGEYLYQAQKETDYGGGRAEERHHDEEEPALFHGICGRCAITPRRKKGEKVSEIANERMIS
jgi:hypothetical protein